MPPKDHIVKIAWERPEDRDVKEIEIDWQNKLQLAGWTKIILHIKSTTNQDDTWKPMHLWAKEKFGVENFVQMRGTFWFRNKDDASYFALVWG